MWGVLINFVGVAAVTAVRGLFHLFSFLRGQEAIDCYYYQSMLWGGGVNISVLNLSLSLFFQCLFAFEEIYLLKVGGRAELVAYRER